MIEMKITLENLWIIARSQAVSSKATHTEAQESCVLPPVKEGPCRLKLRDRKAKLGFQTWSQMEIHRSRHSKLGVDF